MREYIENDADEFLRGGRQGMSGKGRREQRGKEVRVWN